MKIGPRLCTQALGIEYQGKKRYDMQPPHSQDLSHGVPLPSMYGSITKRRFVTVGDGKQKYWLSELKAIPKRVFKKRFED